jgi:hypothetical protein
MNRGMRLALVAVSAKRVKSFHWFGNAKELRVLARTLASHCARFRGSPVAVVDYL